MSLAVRGCKLHSFSTGIDCQVVTSFSHECLRLKVPRHPASWLSFDHCIGLANGLVEVPSIQNHGSVAKSCLRIVRVDFDCSFQIPLGLVVIVKGLISAPEI